LEKDAQTRISNYNRLSLRPQGKQESPWVGDNVIYAIDQKEGSTCENHWYSRGLLTGRE
jgi:hypothetical protein